MTDDVELREELRSVIRRHDPDADTLRQVAADFEVLAKRYDAVQEAI